MDPGEPGNGGGYHNLEWYNVGLASLFIVLDAIISLLLGLGLERPLVTSALRCLIQLTAMGFILRDVFATRNPWAIMGMAFLLILLGSFEVVYNKSKQRFGGMFLTVLGTMGLSTLVVGILGSRFAMSRTPFWEPQQFIPIMGMLLGNAISGMAVGIGYILSQLTENKDKIETKLAYGASRWEAGGEVAKEAVRLAMLPTINQMSVIGLISIPGMMTGVIIGGAPVEQAVMYQQIVMFMISASTALGVLAATAITINICIDVNHRLRPERIRSNATGKKQTVFKEIYTGFTGFFRMIWRRCRSCTTSRKKDGTEEEQRSLLHNNNND